MAGNLVQDNKSKMWNARWWVNGQEKRKSLGTRKRRDAERLVKPILAEVEARRHGIQLVETGAPGPSWEELLDVYRSDETYPLNPKTLRRYALDWPRIAEFLAEEGLRPAQATVLTVTKFVADCRANELSGSPIKNALTAWSRLLDAAVHVGLLKTNYVLEYSRRRIRNDAAVLHPPLNGEFERVLPEVTAYDSDLALLADFLFRTGCRLGEALVATREDIFVDDRGDLRIWFQRGVKRGRPRPPLLNSAEELLPRFPTRGLLFPRLDRRIAVVSSRWGKFFETRRGKEEAAAAREGRQPDPWRLRRWRLHDHRHAFAIISLLEGAALEDVQGHLGHASISTTMEYLKAMKQLPVSQRSSVRRLWRGASFSIPEPEVDPVPRRRAGSRQGQRIRFAPSYGDQPDYPTNADGGWIPEEQPWESAAEERRFETKGGRRSGRKTP